MGLSSSAKASAYVLMLLAGTMLTSCTQNKSSPPSARTPIPESTNGLASLFEQACIEQTDLEWVHVESQRKIDTCKPFPEGDCEMNQDGEVAWQVPTTKGATIVVTMSWDVGSASKHAPGPPTGHLNCSIAVPERLGHTLEESVRHLKVHGNTLVGPMNGDISKDLGLDLRQIWRPKAALESRILLDHHISMDKYLSQIRAKKGSHVYMVWRKLYETNASHPWKLQFIP